jgi:hypothetical protein
LRAEWVMPTLRLAKSLAFTKRFPMGAAPLERRDTGLT